ncbi:ATP-binding cassette domain-containing protein [Ectothiorhodospiraceae bacterium 2226]|nr:ATP-binding cassette domain-containing protein [Ectothiorhodospiraceae bacterium 2226]
MSRLHIQNLRTHHVGPVDLAVEAGECVALAGPSGSGKTLLLRALVDLDPHEGGVLLDGEACEAMPAPQWRRQVGLLPSESQWWYETVGEHFDAPVPEAWLARLGLEVGAMDWQVARASTGERQRLALLRLLVNRPRALLLDEPTASLDPAGVRAVEALVGEYRQAAHAPVLWVSHDPEQARRVAGRRFRIADGRLHEEAA